jgi:hypothetical protein
MYGDADVTVSTIMFTVPSPVIKLTPDGGDDGTENLTILSLTTSFTINCPLNVLIPTPLT